MFKKVLFLVLFLGGFLLAASAFFADVRLRKVTDMNGSNSVSNLIYYSNNGLFYGTTKDGGDNDYGIVFSFNPKTNVIETVAEIDNPNSDGRNPDGSLVYNSSNGLFYGTTEQGGHSNHGIVFSFNPITNTLAKVADISNPNSDGNHSWASLTYNSKNGLFYGTTESGGAKNNGTVFSFNPTSKTLVKVADISNSNIDGCGCHPRSALTYHSKNGLFYGTTESCGNSGYGTIFSFNPTTNVIEKVANISDSGGIAPLASLTFDKTRGLFYGTTDSGGTNYHGVVFSFNPTTKNIVKVAEIYNRNSDGYHPRSSLTYDSKNDVFYGTTENGGRNSNGIMFSFEPKTNLLKKVANIFSFNNNGKTPRSGLTYYSNNGLFYGTTKYGGTHGGGTVFSFEP